MSKDSLIQLVHVVEDDWHCLHGAEQAKHINKGIFPKFPTSVPATL